MSLFPRALITDDMSSLPLVVRLLNDYDNYSRGSDSSSGSIIKSFTPKFDVRELKDSFELYGELPGIEQKKIEIEFSDASTITIKGHTDNSRNQNARHAGHIEGENTNSSSNSNNVSKAQGGDNAKMDVVEKFWVRERSVGDFSRSFSFHTAVDQDNVKASLKNGILSVIVPKVNNPATRKITIQ